MMKTIAITIDEPSLRELDRLRARASGGARSRSRSALIRQAVHQHIARLETALEEDRERAIFRRHRSRLQRQAAALVKEQAKS